MSEFHDEVRDSLGAIYSAQKEAADKVSKMEEATEEIGSRLDSIEENYESTEKWIEKVERNADLARHGNGGGRFSQTDALKDAIPARARGWINGHIVAGADEDTAIKQTVADVWFQNISRLQIGGQWVTPELHSEIEQIEKAFGYKREMSEDTPSEGGYTVPTPLQAEVLRALLDTAVVRNLSRKISMTSKTLDFPTGTNAVTAALIAESGLITASDETFGTAQLVARKFAAFGEATYELLQDSAIGIWAYYRTLAGEQIARLEDAQALEGDGVAPNFEGLIGATGVGAPTITGTKVSLAADAAAVKFAGPAASRRNASWIFAGQTIGWMTGASDATGRPLLNTNELSRYFAAGLGAVANGLVGDLMGQPIYESDQITVTAATPDTANAYYGNFRDGMIFGDRSGMEVMVSPHTKFQNAKLEIRIMKRTGILVAIPSYFTKWTAARSEE